MSRWRQAMEQLHPRHRVHVSADMSSAYRDLAASYPGTEVFGYATGEQVNRWTVPPGWEVDHARLTGPDGRVLADYAVSPLSLWTYSPPFRGEIERDDLDAHLFSIPAQPQATAYHFRNQYRHWSPDWGFCLPDSVRQTLPAGRYQVDIATRFAPGMMEMAEQVHHGEHADSLLLIGHFDHPYMTVDGLIGCLAGHEVIERLRGHPTRLTYRMLSTVEIIGSAFYAAHRMGDARVGQALFVATSGARAPLAYQESAWPDSPIDRVVRHLLRHAHPAARVDPYRIGLLGADEAVFNVAKGGVPCGSLMRAPFAEYHTDADTPAAVDEANFEEAVGLLLEVVDVFENNSRLELVNDGLPCLSHPELDLYLSDGQISQTVNLLENRTSGLFNRIPFTDSLAAMSANLNQMVMLVMAMADGRATTLDVAERAGLPFSVVDAYTGLCAEKGVLRKTWAKPF